MSWDASRWSGHRVVLLAGGAPEPPAFVRSVARAEDLIIAADAGARMAVGAGLVPHLVVGDFDSLTPEEVADLSERTSTRRHPRAKDASDLELALDCALEASPSSIVVLGALGGRLDHTLVNIGLLHRAQAAGVPARILGVGRGVLLISARAEMHLPLGTVLSLLPLTPRVDGVVLRGLRYRLDGGTLCWGTSRGLSNEVVEAPVWVEVGDGTLLALWEEPGG